MSHTFTSVIALISNMSSNRGSSTENNIKDCIDSILSSLSEFETFTLGNALITYSINLNSMEMLRFTLDRFEIKSLLSCLLVNPLTAACERENLEMVSLLLSIPEINLYSKSTVDKLFSAFDVVKMDEREPLYVAIKTGNLEIVKLLLTKVDPRRNDGLALKLCKTEELRELINSWIDEHSESANQEDPVNENETRNEIETKIFKIVDYAKSAFSSFSSLIKKYSKGNGDN